MFTKEKKYITPEEYLKLERKSETKNEYYSGEIFAMPGASLNHNILTTNILANLHNKLKILSAFLSEAICACMFPKMDYLLTLIYVFFAAK
ncbi:MAG: Uma2 family endonuclease [Ignavibacteria bacterium]|nr:Uma2 family endonuclease [Ignavibacteria bacterium]MBL0107274.1 Uma2 family endonuclease [Ignavibacteria bacterium]